MGVYLFLFAICVVTFSARDGRTYDRHSSKFCDDGSVDTVFFPGVSSSSSDSLIWLSISQYTYTCNLQSLVIWKLKTNFPFFSFPGNKKTPLGKTRGRRIMGPGPSTTY